MDIKDPNGNSGEHMFYVSWTAQQNSLCAGMWFRCLSNEKQQMLSLHDVIKREMCSCFVEDAETLTCLPSTVVNCCDVYICGCYWEHLRTSARSGGWELIRVPGETGACHYQLSRRSTLSSDDRNDNSDGRKREMVVILFVPSSWPFVASHPHDDSLFNSQWASLPVTYHFLDSNV